MRETSLPLSLAILPLVASTKENLIKLPTLNKVDQARAINNKLPKRSGKLILHIFRTLEKRINKGVLPSKLWSQDSSLLRWKSLWIHQPLQNLAKVESITMGSRHLGLEPHLILKLFQEWMNKMQRAIIIITVSKEKQLRTRPSQPRYGMLIWLAHRVIIFLAKDRSQIKELEM